MLRAETKPDSGSERVVDPYADVGRCGQPAGPPAAGIVHDLGNLIQIASSGLNRVARDPSVLAAPTLEPVISSAKTALQRAGALVRDTIGRVQESHHEFQPVNVSACLAEVEPLVRSAWEIECRLEIRIPSDLPMVKCDRLGLQNAILNLVFNARDAMPDGGSISIDAAAVLHDRTTPMVELRIADRGIGMKQETIAQAFDPFFTTKGAGLGGIGLPMVRHFAEQYGGGVDIESVFGSGTTVVLRLPAWPLANGAEAKGRRAGARPVSGSEDAATSTASSPG